MTDSPIASPFAFPEEWQRQWTAQFEDYITALAWSPDGQTLAVSSGAGEVVLYEAATGRSTIVQEARHPSIEALAWSPDGQFLAAAGQSGQVKIWRIDAGSGQLLTTLDQDQVWVDRLAWSPVTNHLAYSRGKYVQVWEAESQSIVTTLNFEDSTVLHLHWQPDGQHLAVAGYRGVKIWAAADWDEDPDRLEVLSASVAIAWSPDGQYLAAGNLDRTLTVAAWGHSAPWIMRGFPSKIRLLAWANALTEMGMPLLAVASAEGVVLWEKSPNEEGGWIGELLGQHDALVQALAFHPQSLVLASASDDGSVALWDLSSGLFQRLEGAVQGFSCLAWHPQGTALAAGGQQGELLLWR